MAVRVSRGRGRRAASRKGEGSPGDAPASRRNRGDSRRRYPPPFCIAGFFLQPETPWCAPGRRNADGAGSRFLRCVNPAEVGADVDSAHEHHDARPRKTPRRHPGPPVPGDDACVRRDRLVREAARSALDDHAARDRARTRTRANACQRVFKRVYARQSLFSPLFFSLSNGLRRALAVPPPAKRQASAMRAGGDGAAARR